MRYPRHATPQKGSFLHQQKMRYPNIRCDLSAYISTFLVEFNSDPHNAHVKTYAILGILAMEAYYILPPLSRTFIEGTNVALCWLN